MRLVVQRVKNASVSVEKKIVGKIDCGLLVLVGVREGDTIEDADYLAEKLVKLRVMADENGKMNLSVKDLPAQAGIGGSLLVVSQFTLYADTSGGNRPSFVKAANPDAAKDIYDHLVNNLRKSGIDIETGSFGDYMEINSVLDGPVTIIVDSKDK